MCIHEKFRFQFFFSVHNRSSHEIENLYAQVVQNLDDPENQKTLNAIRFVSKFFTDIVKNG